MNFKIIISSSLYAESNQTICHNEGKREFNHKIVMNFSTNIKFKADTPLQLLWQTHS